MSSVTCDAIRDLIPPAGSRIADIGAGTGRMALPLIETGYEIVAIDSSTEMLSVLENKLKRQGKSAELIATPMSQFRTDPVDFALCVFTVFIYITDETEMASSIENISKHLKPGGYFLFDLASDMFFQSGTAMYHTSNELKRRATISFVADELFEMKDELSGVRDGEEFHHEEVFNVRRWDTDTVFGLLIDNGLEQIDFDDSQFRFTGSRYYLFKKR